jgi:3-oxoacyl-[acyl-carrier protein] reductase
MTAPSEGRVALVTGAGRGIGRAVALELAAGGAQVALLARSLGQLDEAAEAIRAQGGTAAVFQTDVADPEAVAEAAARAAKELGPVDILVNNAAVVQPLGPTVTAPSTAWASAFAVNVDAPFYFTQAVLPSMLDRGWGRIVNVSSSIAAHPAGMLRANAYATSKAALEAHTLNLAAESAGTGVTINVFRPGGVDTAMQAFIRDQNPDRIGAGLHDRFTRNYQEGALLSPEHSASSLLARLPTTATGQIWDAADPT